MNLKKIIKNGIIDENPTFKLVLAMCPTLAITTMAINGIGMGLATTFVLTCSNTAISCMRNFIPDNIRLPAYIIVIATFVSVVELLMKAYLPALDAALGIFIPLIVVNCIIFARAESYASRHTPLEAAADGLGMGLGFTLGITLLASIREIISSGTIFGLHIFTSAYQPMLIAAMAPGGFIILGLLLAIINKMTKARGGA